MPSRRKARGHASQLSSPPRSPAGGAAVQFSPASANDGGACLASSPAFAEESALLSPMPEIAPVMSPELADLRQAIEHAREQRDQAEELQREREARCSAEARLRELQDATKTAQHGLSEMLASLAISLSELIAEPAEWEEAGDDALATAAAKEALSRRQQQLQHLRERLAPGATRKNAFFKT